MSEITCPKCGSNQITADKKGFSGGKAVAGAILTGGIGLLAGTIGSGKVVITCLNCGNQWKPGDTTKKSTTTFTSAPTRVASQTEKKIARILSIIVASLMGFVTFIFLIVVFSGVKGEAGTGALWGLFISALITLLFAFLAKKSK